MRSVQTIVDMINFAMTEIMKKAFAAASRLPPERQDDLARYLLALSVRDSDVPLTAGEAAAIAEAEAELAHGEHVPQDQIDDFWRRNGL